MILHVVSFFIFFHCFSHMSSYFLSELGIAQFSNLLCFLKSFVKRSYLESDQWSGLTFIRKSHPLVFTDSTWLIHLRWCLLNSLLICLRVLTAWSEKVGSFFYFTIFLFGVEKFDLAKHKLKASLFKWESFLTFVKETCSEDPFQTLNLIKFLSTSLKKKSYLLTFFCLTIFCCYKLLV